VLPGEVHARLGRTARQVDVDERGVGRNRAGRRTIVIGDVTLDQLTPAVAQELGSRSSISIRLCSGYDVAENILFAVGLGRLRRRDPDASRAMRLLLDDVHFLGHLRGPRLVAERRPLICSSSQRRLPYRRGS